MQKVELNQAEIEVDGCKYTVIHIPTATSGSWFTIHDVCEVLGGSRHPIEEAIKRAFADYFMP